MEEARIEKGTADYPGSQASGARRRRNASNHRRSLHISTKWDLERSFSVGAVNALKFLPEWCTVYVHLFSLKEIPDSFPNLGTLGLNIQVRIVARGRSVLFRSVPSQGH